MSTNYGTIRGRPFWMTTPLMSSLSEPRPAIIAVHGRKQNSSGKDERLGWLARKMAGDIELNFRKMTNLEEFSRKNNVLVAWPQAKRNWNTRKETRGSNPDVEYLCQIARAARRHPICDGRVFLWSFSEGCLLAHICLAATDTFSAAVMHSGGKMGTNLFGLSPGNVAKGSPHVPVYFVLGGADQFYWSLGPQQAAYREAYRRNGNLTEFDIVPGGHEWAVSENKKLYQWCEKYTGK